MGDSETNAAEEASVPRVSHECIECDAGCGASNPRMRCSRCRCHYYCGRECQRRHWRRVHKKSCKLVDDMRLGTAGIDAASNVAAREGKNSSCPICLADSIRQPIVVSPCRHAFCFGCLRDYQRTKNLALGSVAPTTGGFGRSPDLESSFDCPYCRSEILSTDDDTYCKVLLYGNRAARGGIESVEKDRLCMEAVRELDKLIEANEFDHRAHMLKVWISLVSNKPDAEEEGRILVTKTLPALPEMLKRKLHEATEAGDTRELERLYSNAAMLRDSQLCNQALYTDLIQLQMAKNREDKGDWPGARQKYNLFWSILMEEKTPLGLVGRTNALQMVIFGTIRCYYNEGKYDEAIKEWEIALAGDSRAGISTYRTCSGAHKYVALSYRAKGHLETARRLVGRAILYESPWDEENRRENWELWKKLHETD